jgi:hypothetical protein
MNIKPLDWSIGEDSIMRAEPHGLRFGYNIIRLDSGEFELSLVENGIKRKSRTCEGLDMACKRAERHYRGIVKTFLR